MNHAVYILLVAIVASIQCKTQPALAWSKAGVNSAQSFVYNDPLKSVYYYDGWITVVDATNGTVVSSVNVADVVQQDKAVIRISGENIEFVQGKSKKVVNIARGTLVSVDTILENAILYGVSSNFRYGLFRLEGEPDFTLKVLNYSDTSDTYELRLTKNVKGALVVDDGSICIMDVDSIYLFRRNQVAKAISYSRTQSSSLTLVGLTNAAVVLIEDFGRTKNYKVLIRHYDFDKKSIVDSLVITYPSNFYPSIRAVNDSTIIVKQDFSAVSVVMHSPLRIVRTITLPRPNGDQLNLDASSGYIVSHDAVNSRSVVSIESGNEIHRSRSLVRLVAIEQFLPGTVSAIDEGGYRTICRLGTADMYRTDHERTGSESRSFKQFSIDTFVVGSKENLDVFNDTGITPTARYWRYYYQGHLYNEETYDFVPIHHYPLFGTVLVGFVNLLGSPYGVGSHYSMTLGLIPTKSDASVELRSGMAFNPIIAGNRIEFSSATEDGTRVAFSIGSSTHIIAIDRARKRVEALRSFPWSRTNPLFVDSLYVAMTGTTGLLLAHIYFDWLDKRVILNKRATPLALWNSDSILVYFDDGTVALISLSSHERVWSVQIPSQIVDVVIASDRTWIALLLKSGTLQLYAFPNATSVQNESETKQHEFTMNPNPAFNYISIGGVSADGTPVSIYDLNGGLMYSSSVYPDTQIDIRDFVSGTYFVVIENRHTDSFTINR